MGDPADLLSRGVDTLGLGADIVDPLIRYCGLIETWSATMNLVRASGGELVVRHILDSLAGWRCFAGLQSGSLIADVGSGAGLPGIPLAVAFPLLQVRLVERSTRRVAFLRTCVARLGLPNAEVAEGAASEVIRRMEPAPAAITYRAVFSLSRESREVDRLRGLAPLTIAYKGRLDRILEETERLRGSRAPVVVQEVRVPFLEEERHLVVLRR